MKQLKNIWLIVLSTIIVACGEDRTHEYVELTQHSTWMYEQMKDQYLWGDLIKEQDYKAYFYAGTKFFSTITNSVGKNDSWSYCLVDSVKSDPHERGYFNHLDTYGIDFTLMTDPTKMTSRSFVRVTYVAPGSPAEQCGLHRGVFISMVDSTRMTNANVATYLKSGNSHSLIYHHIDTISGDTVGWVDTLTATLPASTYVEEKAFPVRNFFNYGGSWIGYLMCTRLMAYPDEQQTSDDKYLKQLDEHMQYFLTEQPTELVLDLRLCNYGTIEMAQRLASYIVPANYKSGAFAKTFWNDLHAANNQTYGYDTALGSLELSRVYIIVSNYTQGAAEWLIHGLKNTLGAENVILIGSSATKGQYVQTQYIGSSFGHQLYPVVAYVADGSGDYNYGAFTPDYSISESNSKLLVYMKEFGDPEELLFLTAIYAMFHETE
ncbi:MAG: hypothetical protein IJT97_06330 [Bacteroidaceae bacterium]|nr:hypothetical protein [Bacteroidaceae bacterium]